MDCHDFDLVVALVVEDGEERELTNDLRCQELLDERLIFKVPHRPVESFQPVTAADPLLSAEPFTVFLSRFHGHTLDVFEHRPTQSVWVDAVVTWMLPYHASMRFVELKHEAIVYHLHLV
ncbi:hypothetical protein D3C85_1506930 [compost metagenome]